MAAAAGQAAGMAVGAAVGSFVPAIGTAAGASIGSATAGLIQQTSLGHAQGQVDQAALDLNREQARLQAAERSAIHASNFRQALASQVSLASMRGGAGSVVAQFGQQAFKTFMQDQKAIEAGLTVAETQAGIQQAGLSATQSKRDLLAATQFATTAFEGLNLNLLKPRDTKGGS